MACNYLNFRQLEKINTHTQRQPEQKIFMTFLLCKATKRPVDKRKNPEKPPNQTKAHKKQA